MDAAPSPLDECVCGDFRRQHVGPEQRGACSMCSSLGAVLAADGPCKRFQLFSRSEEREAELDELTDRLPPPPLTQGGDHDAPCGCQTRSGMTLLCREHTEQVFGAPKPQLRSIP